MQLTDVLGNAAEATAELLEPRPNAVRLPDADTSAQPSGKGTWKTSPFPRAAGDAVRPADETPVLAALLGVTAMEQTRPASTCLHPVAEPQERSLRGWQ